LLAELHYGGAIVRGEYDWLGYEYSGILKGVIKDRAIIFDWS